MWYAAIVTASWRDAPTLKAKAPLIEAEFLKKGQFRSCLFDKYRRGEIEPRRSGSKNGELSIVDRVEIRYPGTAKYLELPLWKALDFNQSSMAEVRQVYEVLPVRIRKHFIAINKVSKLGFWRKPTHPELVSDILSKEITLSSLTASLNMVQEGLITQNQFLHYHGLRASEKILAKMLATSGFKTWHEVLRVMQTHVVQHRKHIKYSVDGEHVESIPSRCPP